jgi:hypothetical protein
MVRTLLAGWPSTRRRSLALDYLLLDTELESIVVHHRRFGPQLDPASFRHLVSIDLRTPVHGSSHMHSRLVIDYSVHIGPLISLPLLLQTI